MNTLRAIGCAILIGGFPIGVTLGWNARATADAKIITHAQRVAAQAIAEARSKKAKDCATAYREGRILDLFVGEEL